MVAGSDDRRLGVMAALTAVNAILPDRRVHAVGYPVSEEAPGRYLRQS